MRGTALAALVGALVIGGAPAAQAASSHAPGDPWEKINRFAYAVEGALDRVIFHPAAVLFKNIAPGPIGHGLHNLVINLSEPNAFVNDLLQGRFKRASVPAGRFVTNTTIGLLGLFDVATDMGMVHHDNEFGVTLGVWGSGPGPYMYVPLVGPTTVRDIVGAAIDALIDPIHWASYANRPELSAARTLVGGLDKRVMTEAQLNALLADAADPYATLRSVYLQNKEGEIHGEGVPLEGLPTFDEPALPTAPQPATAGATPVEETPPIATATAEPTAVQTSAAALAPAGEPALAPAG